MKRAWAGNQTAAFLTIENGSALAGDLSRVQVLADQGVRAVTLVWNGENEIGSGHTTDHGLSAFGKAVIPELERCGILVDVSHLNDPGFYDLLEVAQKPFLATHSNARAVCGHRRNLTDEMIREMVDRDCLIGLNYFVKFLRDEGRVESLMTCTAMCPDFLELGAAKTWPWAPTLTGPTCRDYLNSPAKAAGIYEYLLSRVSARNWPTGSCSATASRFFQTHLT